MRHNAKMVNSNKITRHEKDWMVKGENNLKNNSSELNALMQQHESKQL